MKTYGKADTAPVMENTFDNSFTDNASTVVDTHTHAVTKRCLI